ncbi:energy transducer TonB [Acaryochloris marina]|uniref:energy transducer TonB n=1 Tax=Acaryochloris marina TaxID=155978 RepID=UPI001BB07B0D|nr:energy transducer TonB [Acaryochloris marina]QUY41816.1 energy transducer TonB [Acaryochloris marina S15]
MMASVAAHGVLFAGLALVPATGQQTDKKQLRVVSLLKSQPNPGPRPNQAIDPNAPPPAPGVAGLPLNITTPDGLAELPVTDTPNPAFDPFASSIVELPPPPPQTSFTPFNPSSLASLPPRRTPAPPQQTPPPSNSGPSLSDEDFQAWLNGTSDLPNLPPDPGSTGPLPPPGTAPGPVASNIPPANPANVGGIDSSDNPNDSNSLASSSIAPPAQSVKRFVAYDYPKDACQDRLEGKAEYRIWVSSKAAPVVSDIVLSTNSPILDRAVQNAAKKYKIKAEDANKIVVLPFDIKYSQSVCAVKTPDPPTPEPVLPPATPAPTPKPAAPTNTAPETPSPAQPLTPPTPAAPQPNLPPVNPAQPVPPTAPQPPAQSAPALPPQPAQPPAPIAPAPSNPVQPAVPIQEPPTNSDLPPEPAAPQPAPAPPTSPQPPAAAPPAAPSAPAAPAAAPIPSAAPAAPPTGDAPAN